MPEQIQQILNRILEWWRALTTRQKALIISAAAVVVVAIVILVVVVTRPTMVLLIECESAEQSSKVATLLDDNNISYERSDDGMSYYVEKENKADADILLGTNEIPTTGFTIKDALGNGSFTTTEADKQKYYQVYLENHFEEQLETMKNIRSAQVTLSIPDDDGTLIANEQESYAKVMLDTVDMNTVDDPATWAANIAKYMATGLGNDTTNNITIIDTDGNMLFAGGDEMSASGQASTNLSLKSKTENAAASKVRTTLANANSDGSVFDAVDVGVNYDMNFDVEEKTRYDYSVDEGRTEGYLDSETYETTESTEGVTGVPGTDSNDNDTTYVMQDYENAESSSEAYTRDYLPDEEITKTQSGVGNINYEDSSVTIVATNYVIYNEDSMEAAGQLEDTTFEEFVAANSARTQVDVEDEVYTAVSNVTGIPTGNISIIAYDVPMFQYSDSGRDLTDYLQIIIALLVFALLGFIVFRTLRNEEEEEVEEEVTVESLMQQADDEPLEDIGFSDKSEARLLIDKFVEENPDAVANLLRNWLNEDWG